MFENPSAAKKQLLNNKHTVLEGYITEYLYEKQFLHSESTKYTIGWWSVEANWQRFFFVVSEELNDVDRAVVRVLSRQYPVWRAYPEENAWYFYNGETRLDLQQFLDKYHLHRPWDSAPAKDRDYNRQMKCISFFETHDILQKIAIERHFADFILNAFSDSPDKRKRPNAVNIDYIIQEPGGQLCVIEVKFKNKSKAGKFGINVGQFYMFKQLEQSGFEIRHWILYKGDNNKADVSIFDYLAQSGDKFWRHGVVHTANAAKNKRTAPKRTSVDGFKPQNYYAFDASDFNEEESLNVGLDLKAPQGTDISDSFHFGSQKPGGSKNF